ncbi:MAG: DNA helicase UvrD [Cyanobacteria bacterium J055]|nr:MAG: DNA helicase UvrD [Cyanobacteria bacterium J055]
MSLSWQQQAAAYAPGSVAVTAGAGTGKTYMLVERYLYYLQERGVSPLSMVAVTFTDKAARELRSRVRTAVAQQLPDSPDILAELEAAQIGTIHALAAWICRQYPQEAGVAPDFTILDDLEGEIWLADRLQEALAKLPETIYQKVPYSLLSQVLEILIADPISAQRSLAQGTEHCDRLFAEIRQDAVTQLCQNSDWQNSRSILDRYIGKMGDKLEAYRQAATLAIADLEAGRNINQALECLAKLTIRGGSQKNWEKGAIDAVKNAIVTVRNLARQALSAGLITLEWGEADDRLASILDALSEAFDAVQTELNRIKFRSRMLTFADLEVRALQALQTERVRAECRDRYRVFLVDEFQDTNPVQAEFLELLTETSELTIVGDGKQSIYGFRRADVSVFDRFRDRLVSQGGKLVELSLSFRTHQLLIDRINRIFKPLLGTLHQDLESSIEPPHPAPHVRVYTVQAPKEVNKPQRQLAEAQHIARLLQEMLERQTPVREKHSPLSRSIAPGDIAILARTWDALQIYSEALEAAGIPAVVAGGDSLLTTREAKDAIAFLRFLCDPSDDIALVAVLRSPFFAISDRILFQIAQTQISHISHPTLPERAKPLESNQTLQPINSRSKASPLQGENPQITWWQRLQSVNLPELAETIESLKELLKERYREPPSRLLQKIDRATGYTATIANLPNAERREADWRGFRELVRTLEAGTHDVFTVVRRLKRLIQSDVKIPRLPLDAKNAVSLMTVHAAKGLEWSMVVVADLTRSTPNNSPPIYFDPEFGVGLKWEDENGEPCKSSLYILLDNLRKQREEAETLRVLYVALTRARDVAILTANDTKGGNLDRLRPGLETAGIPIQIWEFDPKSQTPNPKPQTPNPKSQTPNTLLSPVGSGLSELPITALSEYAACPQRFEFHFILGHPGLGEGGAIAKRVGTLTHKALELGIRDVKMLASFDPELTLVRVEQAIEFAENFDRHPDFISFRQGAIAKEKTVILEFGGLTFNGVIDLVGKDWILDYKTDTEIDPQHHRFQLWAYAEAIGVKNAHIAYLRHSQLYTFSPKELTNTRQEAEKLALQIGSGNYDPKPSVEVCKKCPYKEICSSRFRGS